jgi:hypothetical protein
MNSKSRKTNPQLVGKGCKIYNPLLVKIGKQRETTESLKRHEFRLFPPLERVAIFGTPLFYFTTFHETSFISVPHC